MKKKIIAILIIISLLLSLIPITKELVKASDESQATTASEETTGESEDVVTPVVVEDPTTGENEQSSEAENTVTIESNPASDGAIAVISGNLPDGAIATNTAVMLTAEELIAYFGEEKAAAMSGYVAYDIKIFVNGVEWQPDETVKVTIKKTTIDPSLCESVGGLHVSDSTGEGSDLKVQHAQEGEVNFETDGFSLFIIYTVQFYADNNAGYCLQGGDSIMLSELLELLEYDLQLAAITDVSFSNLELISVEKVGDDWKLTSLQPFDTKEYLNLTLVDGRVISIFVLDDQTTSSSTSSPDFATSKDKTAVSGTTDEYEVTLEVQEKTSGSSSANYQDVVILLDTTSSMTDRLADMKNALAGSGKLLDQLLGPASSAARVTFVGFSCWSSTTSGYGAQLIGTYTHDSLAAAKSAINNLVISGDSTNLTLGLRKLSEVLAGLNYTKTPIAIAMTDGDPNQFPYLDWGSNYQNTDLGTMYVKYSGTHSNSHAKDAVVSWISKDEISYIKPGTAQFFNTSYFLDRNKSKSQAYASSNSVSLIKNRQNADASYTNRTVTYICADCGKSYTSMTGVKGNQSIIYYAEAVKAQTEFYAIAYGSAVSSSTKTLLQRIVTDSNHYYSVGNSGELFGKLVKIVENAGKLATDVVITDPMGTNVGLVYNNSLTSYTTSLSDYNDHKANVYISTGTLSYNSTTDKITWTIGTMTSGQVCTMKYHVKVDDGVYGTNIPLNDGAKMTYKDPDGKSGEKTFPDPVVDRPDDIVTINYQVTPSGAGTLSKTSETVAVHTGTASGSTATAADCYTFDGWYSDSACTNKVSSSASYTPSKVSGAYEAKTYYAKFTENKVKIQYVAVTTDGGSVNLASEDVAQKTGTPAGSTATAKAGYKFSGWYSDSGCTSKLSDSAKYTPSKNNGKYEAKTYYAKFTELTATISYVSADTNKGTVTRASETVGQKTGSPAGSTGSPKAGYMFAGWYSDSECKNLVSSSATYTPSKNSSTGLYETKTYYAKFVEMNGDLTVVKTGCKSCDENQSFIFHVTSITLNNTSCAPIDMYITIQGNGSVVIKDIPTGTYKVEEVGTWSWRYTADGVKTVTLTSSGASVTINNSRTDHHWMNGFSYAINTETTEANK